MGFYGNTTDTSKTHFQFDKIFSKYKKETNLLQQIMLVL